MMPPAGATPTRGDPVGARDGNGVALGVIRHARPQVLVPVEHLADVVVAAHAGLADADGRAGVDEAGIDVAARGVDRSAPCGTCTFAPTASILPPRITIVPRSIAAAGTGRMRALVIAHTAGAGFCAPSGVVPPLTLSTSRPCAVEASPCPWCRSLRAPRRGAHLAFCQLGSSWLALVVGRRCARSAAISASFSFVSSDSRWSSVACGRSTSVPSM